MGYSLRSKRFRASSARKVARGRKKKRNDPFHFFKSGSNFRAVTRLETLATQATLYALWLHFILGFKFYFP